MASYTPPNTDTPIFDPSQFRAEIPASASTQQSITAITDLINDTQIILTANTAIINTIGSTIFQTLIEVVVKHQEQNTIYNLRMLPQMVYILEAYIWKQQSHQMEELKHHFVLCLADI